MKSIVYSILDRLQRRKLKALGGRVSIPPSTRLLRSFAVRFLATPEDRRYVTVGQNSFLNSSIVFEALSGTVTIGDRCYVGANSQFICRDRIALGDDVTIAWDVMLYDHDSHSLDWRDRAKVVAHFHRSYGTPTCFDEIDWTNVRSAPIVVGNHAWLGFGVVVLKGVTIGEGAIVAARSVVTRDVEPYTVVAGNPARLVRRLDEADPTSAARA